jgi:uncharacterized protein YjbI with pentapeptide repeats
MTPLVYQPQAQQPGELPVLSNRAMAWAAVVLIILGVGLAVALLVAFGNGRHADQLDAIKTAGTIVVGTGGGAALWLTARRQRSVELSLNQTRAMHTATVADAEARRITDLYGKAADQLGSQQAPVRLAGLYALERLAQDNSAQRQTIVDLLCAYLRMPYQPPRQTPAPQSPPQRAGVSRPLLGSAARRRATVRLTPPAPRTEPPSDTAQEYQVRRTAQTILFHHLRGGSSTDAPVDTFWPGINLDLTGALLAPVNLIGCHITAADFTGATFTGDVWFDRARFGLNAVFTGVRFGGKVSFDGARFDHAADFAGVRFEQNARFEDAHFEGEATFSQADFRASALFGDARFSGQAWFSEARFAHHAAFGKAWFARGAGFGDAHFARDASFHDTDFTDTAGFHNVRFTGGFTDFTRATLARADFRAAEFGPNTDFTDAQFTNDATFNRAAFPDGVEFVRTRFDGAVNLGGTRFARFAVFEDAEFHGTTKFYDCTFGDMVKFDRARFVADVHVERTYFPTGAGFGAATFTGQARFTNTDFGDVAGFVRARFDGDTVFDHVLFGGPVAFTGAVFAQPLQIKTVWARRDGPRPHLTSIWPAATVIHETDERPRGIEQGRWGRLMPAPPEVAAE